MSDDRKLSDIGNELHNLSCHVVHHNEDWANQLGALAYELWNWNTRAQLPSQGGEAVEVVAYRVSLPSEPELGHWFDEHAESDPQMCKHEPLMTVAQHQRMMLALVARCYQEGAFKTCLECGYQDGHDLICQYHESNRNTHPADQVAEPDAELVELVRSKFPRIDPCQPVPLDEKAHCCEYTIYVERERLHRIIDAKMASLEVKP